MANYKFTGTITVKDVRNKAEAIERIETMLDDYGDMNNYQKEISILLDTKVEKVSE